MKPLLLVFACLAFSVADAQDSLVFKGKDGPGHGRHIVLIAGDEEYRSEETMPLAEDLA